MALQLNEILKEFHSIVIDDGGGSITIDGTVELGATTLAALESITVVDGGGSLTVDAVDLDIRNLVFADDKVDVSGSEVSLDSATLAALETITVNQGTSPWVIGDGGGSITIDGSVSVSNLNMYAEDSAHVSGDMGMQLLAVRADSMASLVSASGDYSPLQVNSVGNLRVVTPNTTANGGAIPTSSQMVAGSDGTNMYPLKVDSSGELQVDVLSLPADIDIRDLSHSQDSIKIGDGSDFLAINADGSINVNTVEGGYGTWSVITASVGLTEAQLAAAPLSNRLRIEIQNVGSKDVWVKEATGVSTSNGFKIPKGTSWEMGLDAGAAIYAISDGASADLRIAQFAA